MNSGIRFVKRQLLKSKTYNLRYKNNACFSTCKSAYSNINQSMQDNFTECKFTQCMIKSHRLVYFSLFLNKESVSTNFVFQFFYLFLISYPWDCFHGITLNLTDIQTSGLCSVAANAKPILRGIQVLTHPNDFKKPVEAQQIQN